MSEENTVLSLLGGIEFGDPRLYSLLEIISKDLYKLDRQLNPPVKQSSGTTVTTVSTLHSVANFVATLFNNNLRLTWESIQAGATYEIRYLAGTHPASDWSIANNILNTSTTSADINPVALPLVYGNHTFFIKATSTAGVVSTNATIRVVNIPQIEQPTITPTVIDNFVFLRWIAPVSTFVLAHYNVYKNGSIIGTITGTFEAVFETASGVYEYKVEAVDIVGNVGTSATVSVSVNQPRDYELQDQREITYGGTPTDVYVLGSSIFACVNITDTWAQHFTNNGWTNIQDQLDDGYPLYCQPTESTGSYEEVIDYGTVINNVIASVVWTKNIIDTDVNITCKIASSTDNITYTSFVTASSTYLESVRYLKIRFEYAATDAQAVIEHTNIQVRLDVRRQLDSGIIDVLAADTSGTEVMFNLPFLDVESITVTPLSTTLVIVTYDFVDVPNPTSFFIYAWNTAGTRVDATVSWKARGII